MLPDMIQDLYSLRCWGLDYHEFESKNINAMNYEKSSILK